MDFEALLSILLVILYFVFQFTGRKKSRNRQRVPPPQRAPAPRRVERQETGETEWERALREIRAALEEPKPEPHPQRQPPPPAPAKPLPEKRQAAVSEMPERFSEPDRFTESAYDEGFEAGPGDKPVIEQRPFLPETRPQVAPAPPRTAPQTAESLPSPRSASRTGVLDLLRQPDAARNAVLLAEILGPPRSKRLP